MHLPLVLSELNDEVSRSMLIVCQESADIRQRSVVLIVPTYGATSMIEESILDDLLRLSKSVRGSSSD